MTPIYRPAAPLQTAASAWCETVATVSRAQTRESGVDEPKSGVGIDRSSFSPSEGSRAAPCHLMNSNVARCPRARGHVTGVVCTGRSRVWLPRPVRCGTPRSPRGADRQPVAFDGQAHRPIKSTKVVSSTPPSAAHHDELARLVRGDQQRSPEVVQKGRRLS